MTYLLFIDMVLVVKKFINNIKYLFNTVNVSRICLLKTTIFIEAEGIFHIKEGEYRMGKCIVNGQTYDIDGILFDKDGTLLEFRSLWVDWSKQLIGRIMRKTERVEREELGQAIGFNEQENIWDPTGPLCIGSIADLITILSHKLYQNGVPWNDSITLVTDVYEEVNQRMKVREEIKAVSGLDTLLRDAHESDLKLGVVTSDNQAQAMEHLHALHIDHYFNSVIGHDQVERGKPFPDMVEKACEELNLREERTLIIGDSNGDMLVGDNAGLLASIGIVSEPSMSTAHLLNADHIIRDYHAIKIEK